MRTALRLEGVRPRESLSARPLARQTFNYRWLRIVAVALSIFVVQQELVTRVTVLGVHPDLLLLLAVCAGITGGPDRGAIAGFVAGLITDMFLLSPLGLSAFAYATSAYLAGYVAGETNGFSWVEASIGVAASALAVFEFLILGFLTGSVHVSMSRALSIVAVVALVNLPLTPIVTRLLRGVWRETLDVGGVGW